MEQDKALIDGLVVVAGWINALVCGGAMITLAVTVSCILGRRQFKAIGIDLDLRYFAPALVGLTAAHFYVAWLFARKCASILNRGPAVANDAWMTLANKGGLIFSEMEKRVLVSNIGPLKLSAYSIAETDPAAWLSLLFAVAAILATPMTLWGVSIGRLPKMQSLQLAIFGGSAISLTNWLIGTYWAVAASSLAP